ncbi:MAG: hypothetical protein Q7T57_04630 [Dehalococcoidales bacterium]|nr:hypothetical protein [Dehalococcoidales bacterium]
MPKLTEFIEILKSVPDEKRLGLVLAILREAGKVKGSEQELTMVQDLVKTIASTDIEHLEAIKDITGNLLKLVKLLPKDALAQLPLGDIVREIKQGVK